MHNFPFLKVVVNQLQRTLRLKTIPRNPYPFVLISVSLRKRKYFGTSNHFFLLLVSVEGGETFKENRTGNHSQADAVQVFKHFSIVMEFYFHFRLFPVTKKLVSVLRSLAADIISLSVQ